MQPGLTRAVPMGILGFIAGALFVVIVRALQGLDPIWDQQIGIIIASFTTAGAFVWGMGAFNPKMNEHPHEPPSEYGLILADQAEHAEGEDEDDLLKEYPVGSLVGWSIWQVSFWSILLLIVLFSIASLLGIFTLQQTADPEAATEAIGTFTADLPLVGEVVLSQLTAFAALIIFTLLSLAVAAGLIAAAFVALSGGVTVAKASDNVPLGTAPAPERTRRDEIIDVVKVIVIGVVTYVVFYYVLIGLVLPNPEVVRVMLSLVHAVIIALLLVYPMSVLRAISGLSGWLARVLRGLPGFLGNK